MKYFALVASFTLLGCASIEHGSTQRLEIATMNDTGGIKTLCSMTNEEGHWANVSPNQSITIDRDGNPLEVECYNDEQAGKTIADSDFQTKYFLIDFILLDACIISCIIDGANNAFYEYPKTIKVPMAQK